MMNLRSLVATGFHSNAYRGEFNPGPHKFDLAMQEAAFGWLVRQLAS